MQSWKFSVVIFPQQTKHLNAYSCFMQEPQEHGESLRISEQLPSFTSIESPKVESAPIGSQGVLAFLKNTSLKTQHLITATTAGVMTSLTVVAVIQFMAKTVPQQSGSAFFQLMPLGLLALVIAIAVGVTMFALGQNTTNQINHSLDHLQAQFNAVARGELDVQVTVHSPKELEPLAMSFNQMTQAIAKRVSEVQAKAAEEAQAKEELQQKLMQIIQKVELAEATPSEDDEQSLTPEGTILEFLDNLHNWSQVSTAPELFLGSSKLEEIQQRKEELQYRQVWLRALLDETQRELEVLSLIGQTSAQNQARETNEG